jgi:flagellar motor switch protein FliM
MNFCIPSIVLEPIAHRFSQDWYADRAKTSVEEMKKIKLNLLKTRINVDAGLLGNTMSASTLLDLRDGDVIKLESRVTDEMRIRLNGVPKFRAFPVKKDMKKAVQIVDIIQREFKNE